MNNSPLSDEAKELIQELWNTESRILLETMKRIEQTEKEGHERFVANAKRRDAIERKHLSGMTRLEWLEKMGIDPITGKSLDELKDSINKEFPAIKEVIEKMKKMEKANLN